MSTATTRRRPAFYLGHPDYVSTDEAAEILDVTFEHVCLLCRTGKLKAKKASYQWWILRPSLDRYANRRYPGVGRPRNSLPPEKRPEPRRRR